MDNIQWKFVSSLKNENAIEEFERDNNVSFPVDLKRVMKQYNAGQPSVSCFDTNKSRGNDFGALLSFNKDDMSNIYDFFPVIHEENSGLLPFAIDPFGNFLCVLDKKIVFYDHETMTIEKAANSFAEFLTKLYSVERSVL